MSAPVVVAVPGLKVVSEANARGHWSIRNRRKRRQQDAVLVALYPACRGAKWAALVAAPRVRVTLTRVYGGRAQAMDSDNLGGAFKAVRDAVARALDRDDGPTSGVEWECLQRRGDWDGVEIRVEELA